MKILLGICIKIIIMISNDFTTITTVIVIIYIIINVIIIIVITIIINISIHYYCYARGSQPWGPGLIPAQIEKFSWALEEYIW